MINPLHEKQWTQRGTVVYKRKPRSPKTSDVLRFATAAAVRRIIVGKRLYREIMSLAISGVKSIEEFMAGNNIWQAQMKSSNEVRIFIIEEEL